VLTCKWTWLSTMENIGMDKLRYLGILIEGVVASYDKLQKWG
jgi:hypothetical protein